MKKKEESDTICQALLFTLHQISGVSIRKLIIYGKHSDDIGDASNYSVTTSEDLLSMVKTFAVGKKIPVGYFSMDASNVQVVKQLTFTSVPEMKNERLSKQQWEKASDFISILQDAPLYSDDTPNPSLSEIQEKIIQLKEKHGVKVFAFDRWPFVCGDIPKAMEEMARTCDAIFLVRHAR